jgi:hypothetical protein
MAGSVRCSGWAAPSSAPAARPSLACWLRCTPMRGRGERGRGVKQRETAAAHSLRDAKGRSAGKTSTSPQAGGEGMWEAQGHVGGGGAAKIRHGTRWRRGGGPSGATGGAHHIKRRVELHGVERDEHEVVHEQRGLLVVVARVHSGTQRPEVHGVLDDGGVPSSDGVGHRLLEQPMLVRPGAKDTQARVRTRTGQKCAVCAMSSSTNSGNSSRGNA